MGLVKCFRHPNKVSIGNCKNCNAPICGECKTVTPNGIFCSNDCHANLVDFQSKIISTSGTRSGFSVFAWIKHLAIAAVLIAVIFGALSIWLKTTDPSAPRIRVPLVFEIESTLTATPGDVQLGQVRAGTQAERKVVIRGASPFKITKLEGEDEQFKVTGVSDEAKPVHVLKVTFTANADHGEIRRKFRIQTDLPDGETLEGTINLLCSDRYTDIGDGATYQSTFLDVALW